MPGPFATLRADGSIFYPKGFLDDATPPYQLYNGTDFETSPIVFYETGELNPLSSRKANLARTDCKYGVNNATGYCLLTDPSLTYEEQLKQLPDGKCSCDGCTPHEDFMHLSVVGVLSTIICTYTGFALLTVAIGWNANLCYKLKKIPEQWRQLKRANAKRGKVGERLSSDAGSSTTQPLPSS